MSAAVTKPRNPNEAYLEVDGREYGGWTSLRATRGIERCAADFEVAVTERWPGRSTIWPLGAFMPVRLKLGDDPIITGYVDIWAPSVAAEASALSISGRSATADLIDCCPAEGTGEQRATTFAAFARFLAAPYGINVVDMSGDTNVLPAASYSLTDTCFTTLERIARQQQLMLTDDPEGRLVIRRGPSIIAEPVATLREGKDIIEAKLKIDVSQRFDTYRFRAERGVQATLDVTANTSEPVPGSPTPGPTDRRPQREQTRARGGEGSARDPDVPRLRVMTLDAESPGDGVTAEARAIWEAAVRRGRSVRLSVTVAGWRRPDGALWAIADAVRVELPKWRFERNLVVASISWSLNGGNGTMTQLELAPAEGFLPEPLAVTQAPGAPDARPNTSEPIAGSPVPGRRLP